MTSEPAFGPLAGADGVVVRRATVDDLPALVALLTDDVLGRSREGTDPAPYRWAFEQVDADPSQLLLAAVAEDDDRDVVGTLQLTTIAGLSRSGALRGQIEAVRVRADHRGRGTGVSLLHWAVDEARRRGCALVQLTTDKSRTGALRFYERLGFIASHEGLKLPLDG